MSQGQYMGASEAAAYVGAWAGDPRYSAQRFEPRYERGARQAAPSYQPPPYQGGGYQGPQGYRPQPQPQYQAPAYHAPAPYQVPYETGRSDGWGHHRRHHHHHHHPMPPWGGWGGGWGGQPYMQGWPPGMPLMGADGGAQPLMGLDMAAAAMAFGIQPRAALVEQRQPGMANREVLPMTSGTAGIPPGFSTQITSRPQRVAFRPERVFVSSYGTSLGGGGAADWTINDIKIGNRSQFSQAGDVPGDMFATTSIDSFVTFETAQTAMDVVLIATYNGVIESGIPFYGSIVGTAAV